MPMLMNDDNLQLKYWVKTTQGTFGPYGSRNLAESASLSVPRSANEIPEIVERTVDGKQMLLG